MPREGSQPNTRPMVEKNRPRQQPGTLFIVGVPIGHPDDVTIRALQTLRRADIVASEDPAATQALMQHHGLSAKLTSYGPTCMKEKIAVLIDRLRQGAQVAIVSDCGSPVISDPGSLLIDAAHRHHIPVCSVPGPSAVTATMAASGWPGDAFYFHGQAPKGAGPIKRWLTAILTQPAHSLFFCPSQSLATVIETLAQLSPSRPMTVACDLTTPRELILRGAAQKIGTMIKRLSPPEAVTIILGKQKAGEKRRVAARKQRSR